MNKVILMGRLTKAPEVRFSEGKGGGEPLAIARFTLAVDRRFSRNEEQKADFISCVAFGKQGEFVEKYLNQGTKVALSGRIQTGSYKNKDGQTIYTTDVVVEEIEFAESKKPEAAPEKKEEEPPASEGFMDIPEGIENDLPFK